MSTRSDIIALRADGRWARIYCHWDGYIEHNGKILNESYTNQQKVEALIALGHLSSLGPLIGEKHDFEWRIKWFQKFGDKIDDEYRRMESMCTAYGRDRGETGTEAQFFDSLAAAWPRDTWTEFTYVWMDGKWWVGDADEGTQTLVELSGALRGEKRPHPHIKIPFAGIAIGRHE